MVFGAVLLPHPAKPGANLDCRTNDNAVASITEFCELCTTEAEVTAPLESSTTLTTTVAAVVVAAPAGIG